jgi:predicted Zn finger-like uncharacterized protein
MRTFCPTCETGYTIPDDRIGPKGRKVRCTKCGEEWRVLAGGETTALEAAPAAAAPVPAPKPAAAKPPAPEIVPEPAAPREPIVVASPAPAVAAAPAPEPVEPRAEPDAPTAADAPPTVPAEPPRIRIRTKSRMPKLSLPKISLKRWLDLGAVRARIAPFVGPLVFVSACLTVAAAIGFRAPIVAAHPDLAGLYATLGLEVNLRGLAFGRIETLREIDNGQTVLVVEGSVTNTTRDTREVPALRFALRSNDAQELYAWSLAPKTTALAAGDSFRFRTRLAAPPEQAADVQVRFVERRNLQAGLP